jgi:two-component system phosphate regulon sensor histidine kinase PhoR
MSVSLVGIVFVQGYWIKNTVEVNEQQFSLKANQILLDVSNRLELRELEIYYFAFKKVADSIGSAQDVSFGEFFKIQQDDFTNETFIYSNGLLEEDYKISSSFLNSNVDSLKFKKLVKQQAERIIKEKSAQKSPKISDKRIQELINMDPFEKDYIRRAVQLYGSKLPIHRRVPKNVLRDYLTEELEIRNLNTDFEYGIYSNSLATKVRTEDFKLKSSSTYGIALFDTQLNKSGYTLYVNFPQKNSLILSSITLLSVLSIIFTLIIIVAYTSALTQLIRQRQISEIKTDFINNMTHEFKTPIATTKLALDFLKNPKAQSKPEILERYLGMIREENERMNSQVENILQISRLEKNELDIKKEPRNLHDLIKKSMDHVRLLVENRDGYLKSHFGALKTNVLANESHLTNVIVNILDNANKYSPEAPKIDIYTENVKNHILIKIRDQGAGMNKTTRLNIFDKFYRAHTGDVHDVKGHGLGLAYSKRIVEEHYGEITVNSERGKGSTFIIKLPIINQ